MHSHRSFIISMFIYCGLVFASFFIPTTLYADNPFIIDMPPTVKQQRNYVLELRYTYKAPTAVKPGLVFDTYADQQFHALPNVFSLTLKTIDKTYPYTVIMQKGTHSLYFYPHMLDGDILSFTVEIPRVLHEIFGSLEDAIGVQIYARSIETVKEFWTSALPLSIEDMLVWKGSEYTRIGDGDGDVFRWSAYPSAVVLIFRSNAVQAQYLKRLAFFVEKIGTRGIMLSNSALEARKGWGAHDYKADDLARFFEQARLQKVVLNPKEYALKRLLLKLGILQYQEPLTGEIGQDAVKKGVGTLSTVSRSYSPTLQKILLTHELLHAWFFTDTRLRDIVDTLWGQSSHMLKKEWKRFLASKGYDSNFEYLVQNELFAYLLQNSIENLPLYVNSWFAYAKSETQRLLLQEMTYIAETLEVYIRETYNAQAGFLNQRF